ncbi:hypothetical protein F9C07_1746792 [Aspergillus flavus]|uniref:Uncharacterized protein n=2 Tax=Aspergillus subgen. Circumdati TaxID=2720871 RepID=A0A7U2N1J9_ASPFN|nr:hypothetical protein Ao3042_09325 [Aspergillus oryzae 3.042]QRD93849.1 hypothetical protein F9C07_1746792 [Aspergillus flavus]|eukprot:EIT74670.1 hypothetical protein Ao3042_09325 [Aspergillus oryzae 3.042]
MVGFNFSTTDDIHYFHLNAINILFPVNCGSLKRLRPSGRLLRETTDMARKPGPESKEATTTELQSSLRELSLSNNSPVKDIARPAVKTATAKAATAKKKAPVVADSWEDEADESEPDINSPGCASSSLSPSVTTAEGPLDPPPTPISPQTSQTWSSVPVYPDVGSASSRTSNSRSPSRRPEKQTAVAGRMIAGALGLRAPKRTEEQRAYDRAVKEKEIKRRNQEREAAAKAKEEEERAKASVWDD